MVGLNMPPLQNSPSLGGDAIWEKRPAPMAKVQSRGNCIVGVNSLLYPKTYYAKEFAQWELH